MPPKPDRSALQPLRDVLERAQEIEAWLEDATEEAWTADRQLQAAVERNYGVIGEALRRFGRAAPHLVDRIPDFPRIVGFRNRITHMYDTIDSQRVWDVSHSRLADLRDACQTLLQAIARDPTLEQPPPGWPPGVPPPPAQRARHLNTALLRAAIVNAPTVIESLLDAGANPNIPDRTAGRTATHQACHHGSAALVQRFLDAGADFDRPDADGCTPRDLARDNPQLQGTAVLRALGTPASSDPDPMPDPSPSPDL
ncbi:MAG: DUF86 domain-containing protein [Rhodobacteraceae bacterium]|nr:DUF86 domain-containing protein [Paracoccaceae bacterium]